MAALPLSTADVTPTVNARETWFSRSPGSQFAQVYSRTVSFLSFILFNFGYLYFRSFFVVVTVSFNRNSGFRDTSCSNLVGTPNPGLPRSTSSSIQTLAAATRCTGALRYINLIRLLEHPPQLPDAPKSSEQFSLDHPYLTRARFWVWMPPIVASEKNNYKNNRSISGAVG